MTTVVGVSFTRAGKVYWFDPNGLELKDGQPVIVETVRGIDFGTVSGNITEILDELVVQPLRKVVRAAQEEDLQIVEDNRQREADAFIIAQEKIENHQMEMKLVDVEFAFDHSRIVFYFTANGRVDFRELVRDLAAVFRARIELRQIGVRDEAKMIGGLGPCGRPICCRQFLADFQPVSIKMAKEQNLSLNPTKISGLCGRLMCCLKYEQDHYEEAGKGAPRVGREVDTPDGPGVVIEVNILKERLTVKVQRKDGWEFQYFPFASIEMGKSGERCVLRHIEPVKKEEEEPLFAIFGGGEAKDTENADSARKNGQRPRPQKKKEDIEPKPPKEQAEETTPNKPAKRRPRRRNGKGGQAGNPAAEHTETGE